MKAEEDARAGFREGVLEGILSRECVDTCFRRM